jgi:predicted deacylase
VTAATHRVSQSGLANVLRHRGVLRGEARTREALGLPPAVIADATDPDCYSFAPESGLWETFVDVEEHVTEGQPIGQIHYLERPEREPEPVTAKLDGIVCTTRAIATTDQGDTVAVIGRVVTVEDLL